CKYFITVIETHTCFSCYMVSSSCRLTSCIPGDITMTICTKHPLTPEKPVSHAFDKNVEHTLTIFKSSSIYSHDIRLDR
ncbi:Hypothetical predicted protein, partial [Mytilus galloprovincialis]